MSRENEQLAQSINTEEVVVDYLVNVKKMSFSAVINMVMDNDPTLDLVRELQDEGIIKDRFFWGDEEINWY